MIEALSLLKIYGGKLETILIIDALTSWHTYP